MSLCIVLYAFPHKAATLLRNGELTFPVLASGGRIIAIIEYLSSLVLHYVQHNPG